MTASNPARILIVDDEETVVSALCRTLGDRGYETSGCTSGKDALNALWHSKFDLLLTDMMMSELDGLGLMRLASKIDPALVCVLMTGEGTISNAVEVMKAGAIDYILKPFNLGAMLPVLSRALSIRSLRVENAALQQRLQEHMTQLETANEELESFCYSISHDLRAPLRHIAGYADMLAGDSSASLSSNAHKFLGKIQGSAKYMDQLIEGLLRASRISCYPILPLKVDTASLVNELIADMKKGAANRDVEVQVDNLPPCTGDESMLQQVFENLLSNAFKFTRPKEKALIRVGCQPMGRENVYFVRDNGVGFDMRYADKLFGVFRRLHRADEFEGTGVGLSITRRIVRRHGGRIWAEAEVEAGATFCFTVPGRVVEAAPGFRSCL